MKKAAPQSAPLSRDLLLLCFIAAALLLFLSLFGLIGRFGTALAKIQFGLFGSLAYLFPFLFLIGLAFGMINLKRFPSNTCLRILAGFLTFSVLCGFAELIGSRGELLPSLKAYYEAGKNTRLAGGFFGGFWCRLCRGLFGKVGSYVILLVLFLSIIVSGPPLH